MPETAEDRGTPPEIYRLSVLYKLYQITDDGHVSATHALECEDDAAAIAAAEDFTGPELEIWRGEEGSDRLVASIPSKPTPWSRRNSD